MMKEVKNLLLIFVGMVVAGYLALVCVYALPTKPIQTNVMEAANILQMDGSHPELIYGHQDTMLDNLTDSIMLNIARFEKEDSIFEESLLSKRVMGDGLMDSELLVAQATGESVAEETVSYGRYWHGYLLYLKPLLTVLNYGQIRYLIGLIQLVLFVSVLYLFVKKGKENHIIPFTAAYFFMNPAALSLSLQYLPSSVFMMVQFVVILLQKDKYRGNFKRWVYHFFIVGCLISYFDLLTYPLLTLGMPLAFLLSENGKSVKESILHFLGSCTAWASGYAMMWGGKWVLGTILTKENILIDALGNVLVRVGAVENEVKTSILQVLLKNIGANKLGVLIILFVVVGIVFRGLLRKQVPDFHKLNFGVCLCIALPFAWYVAVSNHSYIHYWFTYRILAISIYAALISIMQLFRQE